MKGDSLCQLIVQGVSQEIAFFGDSLQKSNIVKKGITDIKKL